MARRKNTKKTFENVEVLDAGSKGKGIGRASDGRVLIIDQVVPGDVVDVTTYKKRKSYYQAKPHRFVELSLKRAQPVCQHFGVCGGCKWQNMAYEHQLFYKEKEVLENLKRIGKINIAETKPILGSEKIYFYRNKMEFSFSSSRWLTESEISSGKDIQDKNALGFHIPGMWDKILNLEKCHLQEDPSNDIRNKIRDFASENNLEFFNPREQSGLLRTLMIRTSSTGEYMILIQFYQEDKEKRELLLDYIIQEFPEVTSLQYVINEKGNDTIYDQEVITYFGQDFIFEEMEGLKFKINAKSFYQTNSEQAYELYKITREFAALSGDELVYDLYTGTGTIAQFVAKKAKHVVGIEAIPEAIEDAKANAKLNEIENTSFFAGDMKKIFTSGFIAEHGQPDVIITDPPREGMHKEVVEQILQVKPKRIVYVSCNSATQARDLQLMDTHYQVEKSQAVDMFPQTHHVENVVCLRLRA
ncbi:23S rRNA (uracil(1939)-C(5))-methyltransferase RlmD [Psychroflexus sp. YR1-1]|uniref:23S rRNA (Uracil(1939)-C(5))-methyltransferase RlmD n=1 Tax=Psychroflexus aurantiacus TaxID=2709310 RepID=A0A6B3R1C5_9FLAO|nr:23S rRNA (uracil(1939)-C(5))-methyltransferase RlmD [Psychroflexus aurantiacus]NEV94052.1 23S rRNA (uracil(1939)-C(5))-methyltransferase RlmD [Psychroflexus aurantiacus]